MQPLVQESSSQLSRAFCLLIRDLLDAEPVALGEEIAGALATPFSNTTQADWSVAVRLWNEHGRGEVASLPRRSCPACGNASHRPLFESYDGFPFVECEDCECWYVPLKVEESVFEQFFVRCPDAWAIAQRSFEKRASPENLKLDLDRIGGYLDVALSLLLSKEGKPRYLDVGCGLGHSLIAARSRGFDAVGVDASAESVAIGSRRGLDVRHISTGLPSGPFQLVSFWESLEHIDDPLAALSACWPLLDEKGLLAFTVPNQNSLSVKTLRGDCSVVNGGFDTPGHINLFNPSTLNRLLDRAGFVLLDIDGQYGVDITEVLSYLVGQSRGAPDLLSGRPVERGLAPDAMEVISSLGPAIALLERLSLTAPIVFGLACRKGAQAYFTDAMVAHCERRKREIESSIDAVVGSVADYPDQIAGLQKEVAFARQNARDPARASESIAKPGGGDSTRSRDSRRSACQADILALEVAEEVEMKKGAMHVWNRRSIWIRRRRESLR